MSTLRNSNIKRTLMSIQTCIVSSNHKQNKLIIIFQHINPILSSFLFVHSAACKQVNLMPADKDPLTNYVTVAER
jgi:hypothetical protein